MLVSQVIAYPWEKEGKSVQVLPGLQIGLLNQCHANRLHHSQGYVYKNVKNSCGTPDSSLPFSLKKLQI
jgi:hypothetical protein